MMSAQPRWSLIQRQQHVLRIQWNGVNGNGLDEAMTNRQEQGLSVVRAPQGWTDKTNLCHSVMTFRVFVVFIFVGRRLLK